jgi:hypothetical protein
MGGQFRVWRVAEKLAGGWAEREAPEGELQRFGVFDGEIANCKLQPTKEVPRLRSYASGWRYGDGVTKGFSIMWRWNC